MPTWWQVITRTPSPAEDKLQQQIGYLQSTDLGLFLRIIELMQKYFVHCTNNTDRVKAAIHIIREIDAGL